MFLPPYHYILASNSPRRRELLAGLGIEFEVRLIPDIDESYPKDLPAKEVALYIARQKAKAYLPNIGEKELVITADTVVICDDEVMGKPKDYSEACQMLHRLSDRTHQVVTGVYLTTKDAQRAFDVTTMVTFAALSEEETDHYVTCYRPYDKAGSYGIQEWIGYIGVTRIEGSYFNVMGLPVQRIYAELKHFSNP